MRSGRRPQGRATGRAAPDCHAAPMLAHLAKVQQGRALMPPGSALSRLWARIGAALGFAEALADLPGPR